MSVIISCHFRQISSFWKKTKKDAMFPPYPRFMLITFPSTLCCRGSLRPVGGSVCFTQQDLTLAITGHILYGAGESCGQPAEMATYFPFFNEALQ